jgi:hypothetical protein
MICEHVINVDDLTERVDELVDNESAFSKAGRKAAGVPECEELCELRAVLSDLQGKGGDHQWNGEWYPQCLIRDTHMENYAREFADDCGMLNKDKDSWPYTCIDWMKATEEFKQDYSSIEIDKITYWYR